METFDQHKHACHCVSQSDAQPFQLVTCAHLVTSKKNLRPYSISFSTTNSHSLFDNHHRCCREMHNVFNLLLASLCVADSMFLLCNIAIAPVAFGRMDLLTPGDANSDHSGDDVLQCSTPPSNVGSMSAWPLVSSSQSVSRLRDFR